MRPRDRFAHPAWLCLLAPIIWMALWRDLGRATLHVTDEACHTDVARNILQRHRFIDLFYFDNLYNAKPPLKIWLTAILFKLLGQEEFVVRLPDATFGTITTLLVWLIARRHLRGPAIQAAPIFLVLAAYPLASHGWREGVQDAALVMLLTLAAFLFLRVEDVPRGGAIYLAIGIVVGAASIVKSVPAYLIYGPIALYLVLRGRWRQLFRPALVLGVAISIVPFLLWYARHTYGESLIGAEWTYNIGPRLEHMPTHSHVARAYWDWLYWGFKPWGWALPLAGLAVVVAAAMGSAFDLWLLCWGLGLTLPWLVPDAKHPWYVYPAYPAIALALARLVLPPEIWTDDRARHWRAPTLAARATGLAVFAIFTGMALRQTWNGVKESGAQTVLHRACDWLKHLPEGDRKLALFIPWAHLCPDERYYVDLSGADAATVPDVATAISMAIDNPKLVILAEHHTLPALLDGISRVRDLDRDVRIAVFPPEYHRLPSGPLADRALVAIGLPAPESLFRSASGISYVDGIRAEDSSSGPLFWLTGPARIKSERMGCGILRMTLRAYHEPNELRLRLGDDEVAIRVPTHETTLSIPVEVSKTGVAAEVIVSDRCHRPADVEAGSTDTRCLSVAVSDLEFEPEPVQRRR